MDAANDARVGREIVGDMAPAAAYIARDAQHLYTRIRLDDTPWPTGDIGLSAGG